MALEIERKFLVANDGWKTGVRSSVDIRDGLVASYRGRKVRVRIAGQRATITVKGRPKGFTRAEYEYDIPLADAEDMLRTVCADQQLAKRRHYVPHGDLVWEVDVYFGALDGVIIAEIELDRADRAVDLPHWIGDEVTGNPAFSKMNLHARALERRRPAAE